MKWLFWRWNFFSNFIQTFPEVYEKQCVFIFVSLWCLFCVYQRNQMGWRALMCVRCVYVCGMLLWPVSRFREDSVSNPRGWKHSGLVSFWGVHTRTHTEREKGTGCSDQPGEKDVRLNISWYCCRHKPTRTHTLSFHQCLKSSYSLCSFNEKFVFDLWHFRLVQYFYRFFC